MRAAPFIFLAAVCMTGALCAQTTRVAPVTRPAPPAGTAPAPREIPSMMEQVRAARLVESIFKDEVAQAKRPEAKAALADRMLTTARETNNDLVGKYGLCAAARDLAVQSGELTVTLGVIEETQKHFKVAPTWAHETIAALSRNVYTLAQCESVVQHLLQLTDSAIETDNFVVARQWGELAATLARRSADPQLQQHTSQRMAQIRQNENAYAEIPRALETLAKAPDDPPANLKVGLYRCFIRQDWDQGLPHLAKGSDTRLKTLAATDLNGAESGQDRIKLGDLWWDYSEQTALHRAGLRRRAAYWYGQAVDELTGLSKLRVEKRLKEMEAGPQSRTVNLLRLCDPRKDAAVPDKWKATEQTLVGMSKSGSNTLSLPYKPPEEYDLRLVLARIQGDDCFAAVLRGGNRPFALVIGGWGDHAAGFELIGGKTADGNASTRRRDHWFRNGVRQTWLIKVRKDGAAAYQDGKLVTSWKTDFRDAGMRDMWKGKHADTLGIATWGSTFEFYSIEVTEVTGKGKRIR